MIKNKIIVKHSSIVINDYTLGDYDKLEKIFSVYDKICHKHFSKGMEYIEEEKKLILPRGIDIYYLEKIFNTKATLDIKHDPMDEIGEVMIKYLPRDNVQREALDFMIGISNKYINNKQKSQLSVNLPTGKGKSYCSIATISFSRLRTAIITSSLNWLEQWKDYILEYTDIKPREILFLSGSASVNTLLNKKDITQYKIILVSIATIRSYGDSNGWDKVTELFKYMKVGYKFYDEAHLNFDTMCKIDFYTNTYKTYYVTATPARSNEDENRIFQLYFKNIPSIDLFNHENDPHTKYISIRYNSHPTPQEITKCKNQYGLDRNKYTDYITTKENYYKVLSLILNIVLKVEGKTLIYIGTTKAIMKTKEWIISTFPELWDQVGVYTSKVKENKEAQLEKRIILSTTKSCGAAMDIKDLKNTVVLAEPFKSEILAVQTLGRTRADNTFYFEVVDEGFIQIRKFYEYKKPIFEKYALSTAEINFKKQNDLDFAYNNICLERQMKYKKCIFKFTTRTTQTTFNNQDLKPSLIKTR